MQDVIILLAIARHLRLPSSCGSQISTSIHQIFFIFGTSETENPWSKVQPQLVASESLLLYDKHRKDPTVITKVCILARIANL